MMARARRRRGAALVLAAAAALAAAPARAEEPAPLAPFRADAWEIRQGKWRFEPAGELVAE
ncbi:MAG TPA: hypothetical protein VGQ83_36545, partial [Polyangia bacterium]